MSIRQSKIRKTDSEKESLALSRKTIDQEPRRDMEDITSEF